MYKRQPAENECPYCGEGDWRAAEHACRNLLCWVRNLERLEKGYGEGGLNDLEKTDAGEGLCLTGRRVEIANLSLLAQRALGAVRLIVGHGLQEPPVQFFVPPTITQIGY